MSFLGSEWLLSVNLALVKNERTRLAQEFQKLVPMTEMEQQEICVTLLHLLESKVCTIVLSNFSVIYYTKTFYNFMYDKIMENIYFIKKIYNI